MGLNGDQGDNSATRAGAAYYYTRDGSGVWSQQQYIKGSNTEANDLFGQFVAIDGKTIMIMAQSESSNATGVNGNQGSNSLFESGAVYIFDTEAP